MTLDEHGALDVRAETQPQACTRCGTFGELFDSFGRRLCAECLRRRDRIETANATTWNLVVDVLRLGQRIALPGSLLMLVFGVPSLYLEEVHTWLGTIYDSFILVIATGTIQRLSFVRVVHGPRASFGGALGVMLARYWSVWGASLFANFSVLAYTLLLVVPGILRALSYAMCGPVALNEGIHARDSLDVSTERMAGHRTPTFLCFLVFALLALSAGVAEGVVLELFELEGTWAEKVMDVATLLVLVPFFLLAVVLQLKLTPPRPVPAAGGVEPIPSHGTPHELPPTTA